MIKKIMVMLSIFFLASCSSLNSNFDCPMKDGIYCESIDKINNRVNRGEIGKNRNGKNPINIVVNQNSQTPYGQPLRYGETVQRLWIAPYEDTEGNYHKVSEVFVITKGPHWLGSPSKEISDRDISA